MAALRAITTIRMENEFRPYTFSDTQGRIEAEPPRFRAVRRAFNPSAFNPRAYKFRVSAVFIALRFTLSRRSSNDYTFSS